MELFSQDGTHANEQPVSRADRRRALRGRDAALAQLAAAQHGVVTAAQIKALGFSSAARRERVGRSLWPAAPGVYAVGHPGIGRRGRAAAAMLYAGEGAGAGLASAARAWGIERRSTRGPVHISVVGRPTLVDVPGVKFHCPPTLTLDDLVERRGLRLSTPERTVIDLLPYRTEAEVSRLLEQMVTVLGRSPDSLNDWAHALGPLPGKARLIRALDDVAGPVVIKSELEDLFREVCRLGGLPMPKTNYWLAGVEVDAAWLEHRVVVELDSWQFHGGRWQFHHDRDKGLHIAREGYELIRLTWRQLKRDHELVIATLSAVLERAAVSRARPGSAG